MAEQRGDELKRLATRLGQLAVTGIVTWFVADRAGLSLAELRAVDLGAWPLRWWRLGVSCLVLLGGYGLSGHLWGVIVRGLGGGSLGAAPSIRLYMVANLGRYVPGKIWQIAALATLARQQGIGASAATAGAVILQGLALGAAALVGSGALWALAGDASWRWLVPIGAAGTVLVGLTPRAFHLVTSAWFRVTKTSDPPTLTRDHAVGWLVLALVNWIVYAGAFWVMVGGLGLEIGPMAAAPAFAAAYVVGYLAIFAPAGVGVREASLVAFLSPQLGPGTAGAVAVLTRLWTTAVEVVPAAAFWGFHVTRAQPASGREAQDRV